MRKIHKPAENPEALLAKQQEIEALLLEKKEKFKWRPEHYSEPIKDILKTMYHNKCGFCEIVLTESLGERMFTVEHYRPKEIYWWLGNEWTNLFPTCWKCNQLKGNAFPLYGERNKITHVPLDLEGKLDRVQCNAHHTKYLAETPKFLHPEIDDPKFFLRLERSGKIKLQDDLTGYDNEKAKYTIEKLLKRETLEHDRKRHYLTYWNELKSALIDFSKKNTKNYTNTDLEQFFFRFFKNLFLAQNAQSQFSLLGYYMLIDFDIFFLEPIKQEYDEFLANVVQEAFEFFLDKFEYSK